MNNTDHYAREHVKTLSEIEENIGKLNRVRDFVEAHASLFSASLWSYLPHGGVICLFAKESTETESRRQSALRLASHFPDAQWTKAHGTREGMIDWEANVNGVEIRISGAEFMPELSIDGSPVDLSLPA